MKKTAVWRKGDWKRRSYQIKGQWMAAEGYEFEFKLDGITQCSFIGVPDFKQSVFKLRGMIRFPYGFVPTARELPFGQENKEFDIDI